MTRAKYKYAGFIICPVADSTQVDRQAILSYFGTLVGYYWPLVDTRQHEQPTDICIQNMLAMEQSERVYIFYDGQSGGSKFDLGMAFMSRKPLTVINLADTRVHAGERAALGKKDFSQVVIDWPWGS